MEMPERAVSRLHIRSLMVTPAAPGRDPSTRILFLEIQECLRLLQFPAQFPVFALSSGKILECLCVGHCRFCLLGCGRVRSEITSRLLLAEILQRREVDALAAQ